MGFVLHIAIDYYIHSAATALEVLGTRTLPLCMAAITVSPSSADEPVRIILRTNPGL